MPTAPKEKKPKGPPAVCKMGVFPGTLTGHTVDEDDGAVILKFTVETDQAGTLPDGTAFDGVYEDVEMGIQTEEAFGEVLVDLGFAGQTVDWEDAYGAKCLVEVKTYGSRSSARIEDTRPLPPSDD